MRQRAAKHRARSIPTTWPPTWTPPATAWPTREACAAPARSSLPRIRDEIQQKVARGRAGDSGGAHHLPGLRARNRRRHAAAAAGLRHHRRAENDRGRRGGHGGNGSGAPERKQRRCTLDEERKAAMVSNLLVVLCGNHDAQPVVNSGKPVLTWRTRRKNRSPSVCPQSCTTSSPPGRRTISARSTDRSNTCLSECVRQRKKNGKYVSEDLDKPLEIDIE